MRFLKVSLLLSYICIASLSAAIVTPALPRVADYFHISGASLSWVVSIFLVGYVVGQLIYGPLAKSFGALRALRVGLIVNLIGIALCMVGVHANSYALLLIGRLITALGAASGLACTFMLMHDLLNDEELKHAMSYSILSFTLGVGFAVLIGGVITQHLHWMVCFWFLLAHGTIMLGLTWCFQTIPHEKVSLHPLAIIKNYWSALVNIKLVMFSLAVGLMSAYSYVYSVAAPIYAQNTLHISAGAYGYWNLINMVGMLGGGLLGGYLMKKIGPKKLLIIGLAGMVPSCMSLLLIATRHLHNIELFFITTMFAYLFGGFLFPTGSYFALSSIGDKANGSSMMSFINMLSAVLCVIIVGYSPLSIVLSFASVISVFLILVMMLTYLCFKVGKCITN